MDSRLRLLAFGEFRAAAGEDIIRDLVTLMAGEDAPSEGVDAFLCPFLDEETLGELRIDSVLGEVAGSD